MAHHLDILGFGSVARALVAPTIHALHGQAGRRLRSAPCAAGVRVVPAASITPAGGMVGVLGAF